MVKNQASADFNPFEAMCDGQEVADIPRKAKRLAKIGNLWHEYVKDTSLQRKGVKAVHIAKVLEAKGLIIVDYVAGIYSWKGEPLSKQELLDMASRTPRLAAVNS